MRGLRTREHAGPAARIVEQNVIHGNVAARGHEIRTEDGACFAETDQGDALEAIFRPGHFVARERAVGRVKLASFCPFRSSAASTASNHFLIAAVTASGR